MPLHDLTVQPIGKKTLNGTIHDPRQHAFPPLLPYLRAAENLFERVVQDVGAAHVDVQVGHHAGVDALRKQRRNNSCFRLKCSVFPPLSF